jgi:iron complex outermembrane receptor protein
MKLAYLASVATIAAAAPAFAQSTADSDPLRDIVVITAGRQAVTTETARPDEQPSQGPDVTQLLSRIPGGARVGNGALSGQAQYRGLFGDRLNLRVDGQSFASGGPNLMDPTFHYAPATLVSELVIDRGVSPVSDGPGLAGGMDAIFKRIDFTTGSEPRFGYDLTTDARSVDESVSFGGVMGASTDTWRINALGSYESGDDTRFPGGIIAASAFERGVYGLSAGVRTGEHEFSLDVRRQNTGPSGNPPFPMDMIYFDTDFAKAGYKGSWGDVGLIASLGYADVAHLMDNYSLRPIPAAAQQRDAFATATTRSASLAATLPALGGDISLGLDGEEIDRNVTITNPTNAAFLIESLPDINQQRQGLFLEWRGAAGGLEAQLGARVDRHEASAGLAAIGAGLPPAATALLNAFNASDRSLDDTTTDFVARLWTTEADNMVWRFTLARKQKVPGHVERFLWLPSNTSGGLADGNIYIGARDLKPETAWIAEAGFDYRAAGAFIRPTVFVRQVDDYVQGVPFDSTPGVLDTPQEMIANGSGDPTPLRFANVDALLYGLDLDAGIALDASWRIDAVLSIVRGERRDIDDYLYRVAPPSLTAGLTYEPGVWSATFEARAVAEQENVSATNSEARSAGYMVLNAFGSWTVRDGVRLSAGVENLLDHKYEDHLAGYNRISGSDVALGSRLPGAGRGVFIRLSAAG